MLGGGAAGASPSPPKTASSRAAGAGSGGGAAARGVSRASGVGVSSTRAKSFDAGVENAGDTLVRRGTTCEGTRGRRGGAGDGVGAVGGESGRKLAVQLVSVSFWSLPRKLSLIVGLRAIVPNSASRAGRDRRVDVPRRRTDVTRFSAKARAYTAAQTGIDAPAARGYYYATVYARVRVGGPVDETKRYSAASVCKTH